MIPYNSGQFLIRALTAKTKGLQNVQLHPLSSALKYLYMGERLNVSSVTLLTIFYSFSATASSNLLFNFVNFIFSLALTRPALKILEPEL